MPISSKDLQLTVSVSDEQFQQFLQRFAQLTEAMKKMQDQWKQISDTINQTASGGQALIGRMTGMLQTTNKIHTTVGNITKHIFRWGALISGIGTLLGGGGLFGLNRMSESIIARTRFMTGIGGSNYAQTLAATTITKSVLNDPASTLSGIAIGKYAMGSPQWRALNIGMGLSPEELKKTPEQMLPDILDKLPDILQRNVKTKEQLQPFAQSRGLTTLFSMEDLIRMREHPEEFRAKAKELRETAATKPGEKELAIWEKFWTSVRKWQNTIDTQWTKELAPLAGAMTKVVEAFTKLTTAMMQSELLKDVIGRLAQSFEILANIMEFKFKDAMLGLIDQIKALIFLNPWKYIIPQSLQDKAAPYIPSLPSPNQNWAPGRDPFYGLPDATVPPAPPAAPTAPVAPPPMPGSLTPPAVPHPIPQDWTPGNWQQGALPGGGGGGGSSFGYIPGNSPAEYASFVNAARESRQASLRQAFTSVALNGGPNGVPGQGLGPLDERNWQSPQQANLVVRNVPSANVFISANGMA